LGLMLGVRGAGLCMELCQCQCDGCAVSEPLSLFTATTLPLLLLGGTRSCMRKPRSA
jgi:hypothetical protein